jgi:hypothetical protein
MNGGLEERDDCWVRRKRRVGGLKKEMSGRLDEKEEM